ncbi:PEP-CTERM sorting domain-containing protein [Thermodesulfatator atlanticus]
MAKKFVWLGALLVMLVIVPQTKALVIEDLYFDLGTNLDPSDNDSITSPFSIFDMESYYTFRFSGVTNSSNITVGTTVYNEGHAIVQALQDKDNNLVPDLEGMVVQAATTPGTLPVGAWELTLSWSNVSGKIVSGAWGMYKVSYNPGGNFSLYLDFSPEANENGTPSNPLDDTGFSSDADTHLILGAELLSGETYLLGTGDLTLYNLKINAVDTSYLTSYSYDLDSLVGQNLLLASFSSSAPLGQGVYGFINNDLAIFSQGEATLKLDPIPEPTTLLLSGLGLFLVSFLLRKSKKFVV